MARHSSATPREQAPHSTQTTRTATIINALKRRAQAVLNDTSIDAQSRAVIRYALETNDPWLAELVRRADATETIDDAAETIVDIDFSQTPSTSEADWNKDKIEALAEMICRAGDEPGTKSAALLVLLGTLENVTHPKAIANVAKHVAFTQCGELNLHGMVDAQIAMLERDLFAGDNIEC